MSACVRQNLFAFSTVTAIYFLPVRYDQSVNRFVMQRSNLVAFCLGLLLSVGCIYHDFFLHVNYYDSSSPFSLTVFVLELVLFAFVPVLTVLNNFHYRKEMLKFLNVLFTDDAVVQSCREINTIPFFSITYQRYVKIVSVVIVVLMLYNLICRNNADYALFEITMVTRYLFMIQFLYVYHLSVNIIGVRMQHLKMLFFKYRNELDCDYFLGIFLERFERYMAQIEYINRCFSIPLLGMMLQAMIELTYFAFECYRTISTAQVIDGNYASVQHWFIIQFFQAMYGNVLLLVVSSCDRAMKEVEETALCTRHFDDYRLQNTRAAKQIQKFLLKNLHQKKKFSACGFFDIDNTVIYMVFSSIVTYLVILIQFKQLETDLTQSEGVFNVTSNLTTPGPS
uniref:Gustatory receptor n=1 Tax=Anopheles dirus TaxID=7168 RepID=A0A182NBX5_9DIPT